MILNGAMAHVGFDWITNTFAHFRQSPEIRFKRGIVGKLQKENQLGTSTEYANVWTIENSVIKWATCDVFHACGLFASLINC